MNVVDAASVEISPEVVTVFQGEDEEVSAIIRSSAGVILTGRSIRWSIDDPEVAVVSGTGVVRGEEPGTTTVRVETEGLEGAAPVTVLRRPEIGLSRSDVELQSIAGEGDPPDEVVEIVNSGEGTLSGLSLSVATEGDDVGWLSAFLAGSVAPTTVTISASVGSRPPAVYEGTVLVSSPGAHNSPQEVQVTLRLEEPPPIIRVDPSAVSFSSVSGSREPATQSIGLTNAGGGTLSGLSAAIEYVSDPPGWLSVELKSSTAPTVLEIAASARQLNAGTYRAEVQVSSDLIEGENRTVEVIFRVGSDQVPSP